MTLYTIHILQNHAPSNLNRDENGDPKDCVFGGVRRARISSQSLKRSIRFSEEFASNEVFRGRLAQRSQLATHVRSYLQQSRQWDTLAEKTQSDILRQATNLALAKKGRGEGQDEAAEGTTESAATKEVDASRGQLVFLTQEEVRLISEKLKELSGQTLTITESKGKNEKERVRSFAELNADELRKCVGKYEPHSVDIAMFGRMTTSSPFKDIEASVQVAHAISTHEIDQEFDFFTAVDDLEEDPGAGLLGETAFNSATYYKYIAIHWEALVENLEGNEELAASAVRALLRGAALSIPSGKQNSFAAHNLPDFVLVERREQNVPLSYANAFLKPVRARGNTSLMEASISALCEYVPKINRMYGLKPVQAFLSTTPNVELRKAKLCEELDELLVALDSKESEAQ